MSENGEIYIAGKNFTLPPEVRAVTNLTSVLVPQEKVVLGAEPAFLPFFGQLFGLMDHVCSLFHHLTHNKRSLRHGS